MNSVGRRRPAYTLVEVLVTVTVLSIAAALVIPSFGQTDVLRVQAGVRAIVSDLTTAQSDALAFQRGRALRFYANERRYRLLEVRGTTLDENLDMLDETQFTGGDFGDTVITGGSFAFPDTIIFDEMGSPVDTPAGTSAAPNQWIDLAGSRQTYRITVEAYTGRVTVTNTTP